MQICVEAWRMDYDTAVHVNPMGCRSARSRKTVRSLLPLSGMRTTLSRTLLCKNNEQVPRSLERVPGGSDRPLVVSIHESNLLHGKLTS